MPLFLVLPAAQAALTQVPLMAALNGCQISAIEALGAKPGQTLSAEQSALIKTNFSLCRKDPTINNAPPAPTVAPVGTMPLLKVLDANPMDADRVIDGSLSLPESVSISAAGAVPPVGTVLAKPSAPKAAGLIAPPPPVQAPAQGLAKAWETFRSNPILQVLFPQPPSRAVTHKGHVEVVGEKGNQVTVLYVSGSPYEMGYEHGRLLKDDIKKTYDNMLEAGRQDLGKWVPMFVANYLLDKAYARMAPHIPADKLEEMQGLADGSGIPLKTIQRIHSIPDLSQFTCSGLVANGAATKDGHVYQLRILDYSVAMKLHEHPLVLIYRPDDGYAYANIGWTGFIGVVSGMNEKGVAISEKYFGNAPGKTLDGEPMPFVLEDVLRYAKNTEGAEAIVKRDVGTNSYVYMFGDPGGGALAMNVMRHKKLSFRANEGDHVDWVYDEDGKPERIDQVKDMVSVLYYGDKTKLLGSLHGKLDAEAIRKLAPQLAMNVNIQTVIYDLTAGEIWVANRTQTQRAVDREYVHINLKESWSKYPDAQVAKQP